MLSVNEIHISDILQHTRQSLKNLKEMTEKRTLKYASEAEAGLFVAIWEALDKRLATMLDGKTLEDIMFILAKLEVNVIGAFDVLYNARKNGVAGVQQEDVDHLFEYNRLVTSLRAALELWSTLEAGAISKSKIVPPTDQQKSIILQP